MKDADKRKRICWVFSAEESLDAFLPDHLEALADEFEISLVLPLAREDGRRRTPGGGRVHRIPIVRRPAPLQDLLALRRLSRILVEESFDLVHSFMPKAGFLVSLARAWGAPMRRVHTFTGQVWMSRRGLVRLGLMALDRVIVNESDFILADSRSQADLLVRSGVGAERDVRVLGSGSFTGVALERFRRSADEREEVRCRRGLPPNARVIVFLGRINRDKGIHDLAEAVREVASTLEDVYLVVVGPDEEGLEDLLRERSGLPFERLLMPGHTREPEEWLALADVFCLPSYREGFGTSVIEAAATGVPAVATRIPGLVDAVVDGETGLLVPPRSARELAAALTRILHDGEMAAAMGRRARRRAEESFSRDSSCTDWRKFYRECLAAPMGP